MKINGVVLLEWLIFISLVPFFLALTYDLIVIATIANSSIHGGGGDAILLTIISAITYCFACIISIPSIIYIFYVTKKRKEIIKTRLKILLSTIILVIFVPLIYALF